MCNVKLFGLGQNVQWKVPLAHANVLVMWLEEAKEKLGIMRNTTTTWTFIMADDINFKFLTKIFLSFYQFDLSIMSQTYSIKLTSYINSRNKATCSESTHVARETRDGWVCVSMRDQVIRVSLLMGQFLHIIKPLILRERVVVLLSILFVLFLKELDSK